MTRRFRVLIRRQNRPGQSDRRTDRQIFYGRTGPDSRIRKTGFGVRLSDATVLRFNSRAGQGSSYRQGRAGQGRAAGAGEAKQKDLGNFRVWFSGHGFQDLGSQLWGLDFHTRGFQDRNLKIFRM
jgi:hypothetical protein